MEWDDRDMTFNQGAGRRGMLSPSMPTGTEVASYRSYAEAQKAVDYLSDNGAAVRQVAIVGTNLRLVERITGSLSYGRVALSGLMTGAYLGLMFAIMLWIFLPSEQFGAMDMLVPVAVGAGFGVLLGVIAYSMRSKDRDFTSASQVVASQYALIVENEALNEVRSMLSQGGLLASSTSAQTQRAATAPPPMTDESGRPRYGARVDDLNAEERARHDQWRAQQQASQSNAEQGSEPQAASGQNATDRKDNPSQ